MALNWKQDYYYHYGQTIKKEKPYKNLPDLKKNSLYFLNQESLDFNLLDHKKCSTIVLPLGIRHVKTLNHLIISGSGKIVFT